MPDSIFPKLFGRSPFSSMQEHMKVAATCASELMGFMRQVLDEDWNGASDSVQKIHKLEENADAIKREIRLNLPRGFLLPVSRADLLELIHIQDKVPNVARDISGLMYGRRMVIPDTMQDVFVELLEHSIGTANLALQCMNELDELVETGFSARVVEVMTELIGRLSDAESGTDRIEVRVRNQLFEIEKDLDPIDVMFLYRAIEWVGDIADHSETIGSRILTLIAR